MHGFPNDQAKPKPKKKPAKSQNFLEALRDLGSGVVDSAVHDVAGALPDSAYGQMTGRKQSGELKPNQSLDVNQSALESRQVYQEKKEQFGRFQQEFLDIRRQEKIIYKETDRETKLQIAALLEELKKLSLSTKKLAKEVQIASLEPPVEPGVYHVNFYKRLRRTILLFKKKIDESATWLETFDRRGKKQGHYWGQVKKSGTKFMMSQERYIATQAG